MRSCSWTCSLPRSMGNGLFVATHVVNFSWRTKASYMLCRWSPSPKFWMQSSYLRKEVGAPDAIVADAAREQKSDALKSFLQMIGTRLWILEEGAPWANWAKLYLGVIKEACCADKQHSNCPLVFWDYCVERWDRINNLKAKIFFQLRGQTPHTDTTGETGDISNLCSFDFW